MKIIATLAALLLTAAVHAGPAKTIYTIGNSLTEDTAPWLYADAWHVFCSRNLAFIYEFPDQHCNASSTPWPDALTKQQYEFVTVQPFNGTSLQEDFELISLWMLMQPRATFVVHSGWAEHALHNDSYNAESIKLMVHSPAYFSALVEMLRERFGYHRVRFNPAFEANERIRRDILSGVAPFSMFDDLFLDSIHMTRKTGRYLQHNLMRRTLGMPPSAEGFATVAPHVRVYLDGVVDAVSTRKPVTVGGSRRSAPKEGFF
ncbi:MAG: hypothetical protein AB8G17_12780 [Gammaproteobacteria bacterium]